MDLTRRRLVAASSTLVTSTALAGCSGNGSDDNSQNNEPSSTQEQPESQEDSSNSTEDGSTSTGEPDFEVTRFDVQPRMVPVGDEMAVNTQVENVGSALGIASFEFTLGSEQFTWESDEIEAGATSNDLTIRFQAPDVETDRYDFDATLNGEEVATLPVDILPEEWPPDDGLAFFGSFVSATRADVRNGMGRVILFGSNDSSDTGELEPGEIGQFGIELSEGEYTLRVSYVSGMVSEFNGVPDVFAAERGQELRGDSTVILGQYTLPEAYRTEVRLVDESGNPVTDFTPSIRDENGSGIRDFTTNEDGYLVSDERTETGVDLPPRDQSNIVVDARPSSGGQSERFGEIYGSPDGEEFEFTVSDPDRF